MVDITNNWSPVHTYPYSLENATFFSVFKTICVHTLRFHPSTRIRYLDPSAYGFGNARVNSGNKWRLAGVTLGLTAHAVWFQQKNFSSFISTSSRKFCAASELELKKLTEPLRNFQVSKALVLAAEKIALTVRRFETWNLHMLDSWLNICVDYFTKR